MPLFLLMANLHGRLLTMNLATGGTFGDLQELGPVHTRAVWLENLCGEMYQAMTEKMILRDLGVLPQTRVESRLGSNSPTRGCRNLEGLHIANKHLEREHKEARNRGNGQKPKVSYEQVYSGQWASCLTSRTAARKKENLFLR